MKKNSKNLSASVQPQLSQQQATPLSTLTLDELESVQGGKSDLGYTFVWGGEQMMRCLFCNGDNWDLG